MRVRFVRVHTEHCIRVRETPIGSWGELPAELKLIHVFTVANLALMSVPLRAGSNDFESWHGAPQESAEAVKRLERAGAHCVGCASMSQ